MFIRLIVTGAAVIAAGGAMAADPTFDCNKAASSAEEAICASDDLAALDRELAAHYARAVKDAGLGAERLAELKAMQRGWIKGRDDCWKSSVGLEQCVAAEYAFRIAEIRTGYAASRDGESGSAGPFPYVCDGMDIPLSVVFVNAGTPRAVVSNRDGAFVATAGPAGSGVRYVDGETVFHTKGQDAILTRDGNTWTCRQDDMG